MDPLDPQPLEQLNRSQSRSLRLSAPIFVAKTTKMTRLSIRSRDADEDREGDILLDHWLRGGSLILLNLLRESRESGEDEQRGDCEISDGLVHGSGPFFKMFVIRFTPRLRTRTRKVTRNLQKTLTYENMRKAVGFAT